MIRSYKNRLAKASSPYLLQHVHNPVDWYEWGEEAFQKAREEDKPLIISIGYSACHWCHVMARESYMDEDVAQIMNDYFVAIKVDREERPDIDQIYIDAAQLLNGNAGWPLNVFALPDGRPFWAGTYFPKENWLRVLAQLVDAYSNNRSVVREQAENLTKGVNNMQKIQVVEGEDSVFDQKVYKKLYDVWQVKIDKAKGGFRGRQKFPMTSGWEFLLQYHYLTGNERTLQDVNKTLTAMAFGGIYDQVGGGFSRYATDEDWFAPHFEKMLYDNAQLVSLYAQAYRLSGKPLYEEVIKETLHFVSRELTSEEGGFYSALNAESEGKEGAFYVWTAAEIKAVLDEEKAHLFQAYYNVIPEGNWEGDKNILFRNRTEAGFAEVVELPQSLVEIQIHSAKRQLLSVRNKRIRPSTDDKILTSWNALMLTGYLEAYRSLGEENYYEIAVKNAAFLKHKMIGEKGELYRNYKDGKASIPAFLDDYAFLAEAFVHLYQVSLEKNWLEEARQLVDYTVTHFYDPHSGLFYYTSNASDSLVARKIQITHNEMPSSNATMATVLYTLGNYLEVKEYLKIAKAMVLKITPWLQKGAPYFGKWAQAYGLMGAIPFEVDIMGDEAQDMSFKMQNHYLPTTLFSGGQTENLPLLKQKLVSEETRIYVCRNKVCQQPETSTDKALEQIAKGVISFGE